MILINPDNLLATGKLEIVLVDANGRVKDHRNVKNTVTISGKRYIARRMKDSGPVQMTHMEIGEDVPGPTGDTDDNIGVTTRVRKALTTAGGTVGTNPNDNSVLYQCTFTPADTTGDLAVTKAAIFNYSTYTASPTAGSQFMLCRTSFAVVNKLDADTLTINWTVTIN